MFFLFVFLFCFLFHLSLSFSNVCLIFEKFSKGNVDGAQKTTWNLLKIYQRSLLTTINQLQSILFFTIYFPGASKDFACVQLLLHILEFRSFKVNDWSEQVFMCMFPR